ncbi:DUF4435 domain-containing protein [Virgibacillus siamensis]|uniref:DUF4435 domain-containing protein n=1 Tax=Virgibacillus siamensis TaxID=480071 RepID=UPI000984FB13|nr:DUF4435 domain-containing protein [Virgibacillus siamensis]
MSIGIKFPNDEIRQFEQGKPIVLLGANGAGKTRLSVKIEELNDPNFNNREVSETLLVQRITAQKSLSLSESIVIKGLDSAEKEATVGSDSPNSSKFGFRYGRNPATSLLNDYDKVLSLFFARNNKLVEQYHEQCRIAQSKNEAFPPPIKSLKEKAQEIWDYLLPNRQLDLSGNEVHVIFNSERYHGKEMSDGERVILYMIVQALSVKPNSMLIIDEPELHIHKAIIKKLWDKLEEERQDCVFMYITHDLDFAVSRSVNEVLWVKSYNGNEDWDYEFLPLTDYSELPEGLLFEMLGTQKKVIFVEGTKESLDYLLFQELYKDLNYHIIPCGGCSQVINYVKAKKGYSKLDYLEVYGIIDRDFRPDSQLESLRLDGIFALDVAEVENLFIVPEMLEYIKERLGKDEGVVEEIKDFVIRIYNGIKQKQLLAAFSSEMNHQLKTLNLDENIDSDGVKRKIENKFSKENIDSIFKEKEDLFLYINEYEDILKIFNFKELSDKISPKFGLQKGEYRKLIINLLKRSPNYQDKKKIIEAIRPYTPYISA